MEIKVLVVDDEMDFLETIVKRLGKKQLDAVGVSSGEDALVKIKEKYFDVILLDIKMPGGMDGLEALKEIKKERPLSEVILLTGHGSVESSVEGMRLGAFDYILKPAKFEELCEKIAQAYMKKSDQDDKIRKANVQQLLRFPGRVFDQE
ncbi:MAG: response regulator [Thermodesulfobacteriota bacterium]|nr:response regulator [Thermodesulfobacteriota bacterium]